MNMCAHLGAGGTLTYDVGAGGTLTYAMGARGTWCGKRQWLPLSCGGSGTAGAILEPSALAVLISL